MWISVSCWNSKNQHLTCKGTGSMNRWMILDRAGLKKFLHFDWLLILQSLPTQVLFIYSVLVIGMAYSTKCILCRSYMPYTRGSSPSHKCVDIVLTIFALLNVPHESIIYVSLCIILKRSYWNKYECSSHKSVCKIVLRSNFLKMAPLPRVLSKGIDDVMESETKLRSYIFVFSWLSHELWTSGGVPWGRENQISSGVWKDFGGRHIMDVKIVSPLAKRIKAGGNTWVSIR